MIQHESFCDLTEKEERCEKGKLWATHNIYMMNESAEEGKEEDITRIIFKFEYKFEGGEKTIINVCCEQSAVTFVVVV